MKASAEFLVIQYWFPILWKLILLMWSEQALPNFPIEDFMIKLFWPWLTYRRTDGLTVDTYNRQYSISSIYDNLLPNCLALEINIKF